MKSSRATIPALPAVDNTLAFLREGYLFVGNRCDALGSDAFRTRIMLHKVVCMRGPAAAEQFYRPGRFTRRGAMPRTALALLQDWGSVQMLDGAEHRHRKQMFMDVMSTEGVGRAVSIFDREWREAERHWAGQPIVLHDAAHAVLARTAVQWCGIPLDRVDPDRLTAELSAMVDEAGSFGPRYLHARLLRRRCERWARKLIEEIRAGRPAAERGSPAEQIALHQDLSGGQLSSDIAAVELINLLRPIVAISHFIVFAAHALHVHRAAAARLSDAAPEEETRAFVQEVRRFYPFFPMVGGRVLEGFSWRDHRFARGDWVLLDLYGTNHHPEIWRDSRIFDPRRFLGWEGNAYSFIAQGGGGFLKGHRCAGEWLTIALTSAAVRHLTSMDYAVPDQDLEIPLNHFPPLPRSGFILQPRDR